MNKSEMRKLIEEGWRNPPYRPKCEVCAYDGGAFLLGVVALKHALQHTQETQHKVTVYQGSAAE